MIHLAIEPHAFIEKGEVPHLTVVIMDGVEIDTGPHMHVIEAAAAQLSPKGHDADMATRLAAAVGMAKRMIVAYPIKRINN